MSDTYIVKDGDTTQSIARRFYGDQTLSYLIDNANQSISTGDTIVIPPAPESAGISAAIAGEYARDDLLITISGVTITPLSARITRTMDTGADGWSATIPWSPGDNPALDRATVPYGYTDAVVYIGGNPVVTGLLYKVSPRLSSSGRTLGITGWSYTADAVDSTLKPPYERGPVTLEQLATELVEPLGIKALFDLESGGIFDRVAANASDTIFKFLSDLAVQRGLLVTSTAAGNMLFTKARTDSAPVGTLSEGGGGVREWSADFDGRKRFNSYRVIGQSPGANAKAVAVTDPDVPRSRFITFAAQNTTSGNIRDAAEWRKTSTLARALTMPLTVTGWLAPDGNLWQENTKITIVSQTLRIPDGYDFLIRSVEYILTNQGRETKLNIVPPEVYSGEEINIPWS